MADFYGGRFFKIGRAPVASAVTVNGAAASRQGEMFRSEISATNTSAPVWQAVSVADGTTTVTGHRFIPSASVSPTYDGDGNLTSDGRWTYTWDAENRLASMTTMTSATSAGVPYRRLVFDYDAYSRRLRKRVYDVSGSGATPIEDRRFVYDAWNLVAEYTASGSTLTLARTYTWGTDLSESSQGAGGVGGLLAVKTGTSERLAS